MTPHATFAEQYDALRNGRGFVELTNWSSITFTGTDRQKFLHSFCTNDVNRLASGQGCEAFITNAKGKIIGYGYIDCRDDELVFITVPNQAAGLIAHFDRYIIREDVQLRDTSSEHSFFHVGPTSPPDIAPSARWIGWKLCGPNSGAVVEVPTAAAAEMRRALVDRNFVTCGDAAFNSLRIEAGVPLFGIDFDDNLPQEVNRDEQAISFTKGCYLGQETVARIDALGHVNQKLVGVRFFGEVKPESRTELHSNGKVVGTLSSTGFSLRLNAPIALAMIRREANTPGTRLESPIGECEVIALPLTADD